MEALALNRQNFVDMLPVIHNFLAKYETIYITTENSNSDISTYDYIKSKKYKSLDQNDKIINNKLELKSYLSNLKK